MNLFKINKILMWVLIAVSVALLVWGAAGGFLANDAKPIDAMLYWAYVMLAIGVVGWVVVGGVIAIKNNPKALVKGGILLLGCAALCLVAYLLAPGTPAFGRENPVLFPDDTPGMLKLTDTILNLTYILTVVAIVSIIVGEIRMSITNRK